MGSNKDQLQAHQFMLQRVISALAVQETDPEQPPFRRPTIAAITGIVIAILSCGAVWVFGLLVPGGNKFTATDVIAVEEETGARFVLMDGELHPVKNYTSALLALDKHAEVRMVSHATLAGIPAGVPIGIPDAPDSLPGKDQLLTGAWTSCSQPSTDAQNRSTQDTILLVGHLPDHSTTLSGRTVVVRTSGGHAYLLYRGYRHEISRDAYVALGIEGQTNPIDVADAWRNTVPLGDPIGPATVANAGKASTALPGKALVAGQLVEVDDGSGGGVGDGTTNQFYLVQSDHLAAISPLQARVQAAVDPHADPAVRITTRELSAASRTPPTTPQDDDAPRSLPPFVPSDGAEAAVCAVFQPGESTPQLVVDASLSAADKAAGARSSDGAVRLAVPGGKAALVEVMMSPSQGAGEGTIGLVDDQGRMHPLSDPLHVQQVLGYDGVKPVLIDQAVSSRVPQVNALNPDAARTPLAGG